ncbi:uncharacterized protein OCT59_001273 [Rhizophagus irregularis]|uniref:Uncharacterized protein n=3 Tax=Rhizophagus irregularis TaxID=588596 RepID=A0A015L3Z0_RHIIW|nr:hypothetical protein RirG_050980 [Rhizophagus irregularis DAOM 197198w]UZO00019.1 hypothetical protein OCT59_001273 [Rhizophagus irregularis]GBC29798.2 hypothetical protein GLOIN_2v1768947 [Rhizophagus irregularis DAOM 181602=DAOM 197198]CAB4487184.1 unnamed protein product [Rhizophagus irregularis]
MNLAELFRGHRRSEPTTLLLLKLMMMIILVACLTGYLSMVIIDVVQDAPIVKTSFVDSNAIPPPSFIFKSNFNFTITTCHEEYYQINATQPTSVDCKSDITHPDEKYGPAQLYFGFYQPSPDVFFYKYDSKASGMMYLNIVLVINDVNYTPDQPIQAMIDIIAFDSDYDPLTNYIKEKRYYELTTPEAIKSISSFDNSIITMNTYTLVLNQLYQFVYNRKIEEVIRPNWMNDFGFPPSYENKSHIESTLLATLLPINLGNNSVLFSVHPKGNTVQINKEVRNRTYLGGVGLIGGAWGLAAAVYALLFGADTLRPWGVVQSYCCGFSRLTQKKLEKTLPTIPFFDTINPDIKNHPSKHALSSAEQNKLILTRIDSLELFLQEYVVDVHYLNGIRDKLSKERATLTSTTDVMNNLNNQTIRDMRVGFDNLNTNSMYTPISATATQQQQEGLMITVPPQSSTTSISDTNNTLYNNNLSQQNPLSQQQQ